jgi:3-hydroxyisobutyrate dehydrogenase
MNIGFIGLGIMGSAMAGNLLARGFPLVVWNRTTSKTTDLVARGARPATSIGELAGQCNVVCINVTDTPDVEQVLFGPGNVFDRARPGTIVIDHSTIRPDRTVEFAKRLADRQITLLDAPVSGGDVGAKNATLSIMVGGDATAFERVTPVLQTMGKNVVRVGASGAGQVCKACNQICVLVALAGVCEAVAFAQKNGLDARTMVDVVAAGAGGSWQLANLAPKMIAGDLKPAFMIELALKDMKIVEDVAASIGLSLDSFAVSRRRLEQLRDAGHPKLGTQAMILAVK